MKRSPPAAGERFTITETLGKGAYGTVQKAITDSTTYAVKTSESSEDVGLNPTFIREESVSLKLDAPNLVKAKEIIISGEVEQIVLPLYDGTLRKLVDLGTLTRSNKKKLMLDLARGMDAMHSAGIAHRDLKPENVLYRKTGNDYALVITDFGLARVIPNIETTLTQEVQTLWYRSPEVLLLNKYDLSADIWSLGLLFLYIETGIEIRGDDEDSQIRRYFGLLGIPDIDTLDLTQEGEKYFDRLAKLREYGTKFPSNIAPDVSALILSMLSWQPWLRPTARIIMQSPAIGGTTENIEQPLPLVRHKRSHSIAYSKIIYNFLVSETELEYADRASITEQYENSKYLNNKSRTILFEWLIDIGKSFKLLTETTNLTLMLVDAYLVRTNFDISSTDFQKLGCVCCLIASKLNEIYSPEINDFVYISDQAFTTKDIRKLEREVVRVIGDCYIPTLSRGGYNLLNSVVLDADYVAKRSLGSMAMAVTIAGIPWSYGYEAAVYTALRLAAPDVTLPDTALVNLSTKLEMVVISRLSSGLKKKFGFLQQAPKEATPKQPAPPAREAIKRPSKEREITPKQPAPPAREAIKEREITPVKRPSKERGITPAQRPPKEREITPVKRPSKEREITPKRPTIERAKTPPKESTREEEESVESLTESMGQLRVTKPLTEIDPSKLSTAHSRGYQENVPYTVNELRSLARERGLPAWGTKDKLVERLSRHIKK